MLSVIVPIFNRKALFARSLQTIKNQSFKDFEIILVNSRSTDDYSDILHGLKVRHIVWDNRLHPFYKEMNPKGNENNWYHTPAQAINIGISKAQGDVILITQPEILHSPDSFRVGYERALNENKQIFGEILMGDLRFNSVLNESGVYRYDDMAKDVEATGLEYNYSHQPTAGFYEMYWFVCFLPTQYARDVNGVDLKYQKGVYAEDDQFKMRVRMAGCPDVWGGRPMLTGSCDKYVVGIHQSHRNETYKNQLRNSNYWNSGAERNRELFRQFCLQPYTVANEDIDPWGEYLIVEDRWI